MQALFIVLNNESYLDQILSILAESGVKGATIIDSQGMASAMSQNERYMPFFGALKIALEDTKPYNKTIFSVIHDDQIMKLVTDKIMGIFESHKKRGTGFMFTVPVGQIYPLGQSHP
jgi:nitrogen regulatory protein PII